MPIIYTYPKLDTPQGNELIVITDVNDKKFTKQITAQAIANLFDCDTCTQYCTSSISAIGTPFGTGVSASGCGSEIIFTSTGGTMTITGNGTNTINFESLGQGGGMSNWILKDDAGNPINVGNADEVTLGLQNNGLLQVASLGNPASSIKYGVNYDEDDGTISNLITTATAGSSLAIEDIILYADSTNNFAVKAAELDELPFCTKSIKTVNVKVGETVTQIEAEDCNGAITLQQGNNIELSTSSNVITISGQAGSSGCADAISVVAADNSNSTFTGCGNTLSITGGTGISVLTNQSSTGVVISSTTSSGAVAGTFVPILVYKGATGSDPLIPHPGVSAYTIQEATYNVDNYGQVYIDFAFQFTKNPNVLLDGTLGVAVNDNGTIRGFNSLPGLADLKTSSNANAGCDISEVSSINDGGLRVLGWGHAAQGGKLCRYYDATEDKVAMWFYWLFQNIAGGPIHTEFSVIGGEWVSTEEDAVGHYLSGSFNPILIPSLPENTIYWKPCEGTDWSYQSVESLPASITSTDDGDVWKSNTCYELSNIEKEGAVPGSLPEAQYSKIVGTESTDCECCTAQYLHYQQCPELECEGFPLTFSVEVTNPAVPAVTQGTITVESDSGDTCCYTRIENENCTSNGLATVLFPDPLVNQYESGAAWAGEITGKDKDPNCDECGVEPEQFIFRYQKCEGANDCGEGVLEFVDVQGTAAELLPNLILTDLTTEARCCYFKTEEEADTPTANWAIVNETLASCEDSDLVKAGCSRG